MTSQDTEFFLRRATEEAKLAIEAPDPASHRAHVALSQHFARMAKLRATATEPLSSGSAPDEGLEE